MINPLSLSLSGLMATSRKAADAAGNIVNASSSGSPDPSSPVRPYQPVDTVIKPGPGGGVIAASTPRTPAFVPSYEPGQPFADENGMVAAPNVNLDEELINLKVAEQAYKANAQVLKVSRTLQDELLTAIDRKV